MFSCQVERYEYIHWLCEKLIQSGPTQKDVEFLVSIGRHILRPANTSPLAPRAPLARVVVHHLFGAAAVTSGHQLTDVQQLGLAVAMSALDFKPALNDVTESWILFQFSFCQQWSKLAFEVLCAVAASKSILDRAVASILHENGLLGLESSDTPSSAIKCEVACTLGQELGMRSTPAEIWPEVEIITMGKAMKGNTQPGFIQSLRFPAIQLVVHGLLQVHETKDRMFFWPVR